MYKKVIIASLLCAICLAMPCLLKAQAAPTYDSGLYIAKGDTLPYRILFPQNFDPAKKYPLILLLHGAGERGTDNQAQLNPSGKLFLKPEVRQQYPAIVVIPQCLRMIFGRMCRYKAIRVNLNSPF
jgi:predicted peptidase